MKIEKYAIRNKDGKLWTDEVFNSYSDAISYLDNWIKNENGSVENIISGDINILIVKITDDCPQEDR